MFHWVLNIPLIWLIRLKYFTDAKMMALHAYILAPDIEQCRAKNRLLSDKSCFTTDTVVRQLT